MLAGLALVALLNAHTLAQLFGSEVAPSSQQLASPPPSASFESPPVRERSAQPILEHNPFDHETDLLPENEGAPSTDGGPPRRSRPRVPLPEEIGSRIRPNDAGEITIDRALFDRVLQDQAALTREARAIPVREDGGIVGVRLAGVRPDGLLGKLGIQNGDEIRTINGYEVGAPDQALAAYSRLASAERLTVQLRRGGAIVYQSYVIR